MYFIKTVATALIVSSALTSAYVPTEQQHPLQKPPRAIPHLHGKFLHITDIHVRDIDIYICCHIM